MINTQREKNSLKSTVKEGKISLNEKWNKTKMRYLNNWLWKVRQPLLILSPIVFKLKIVFKVKIVFSWQILLCWGSPHSFSHGRSLLATLHCFPFPSKTKKINFGGILFSESVLAINDEVLLVFREEKGYSVDVKLL